MTFLVLSVIGAGGAGLWAQRHWGELSVKLAERALTGVMWTVLPVLIFLNVAHFRFTTGSSIGLLCAYVAILCVGAVAWLLSARVLKLSRASIGSVVCCSMVGNTGYVGVPLIVVLLGSQALPPATAWDAIVSSPVAFLPVFAIGSSLGNHTGIADSVRRLLLRNPVLWALALGILAPSGFSPQSLVPVSQAVYLALLPISCLVLGVLLAADGRGEAVVGASSAVLSAVSLRMLMTPAIFVVLTLLTRSSPSAFYLQAATPCGFNALLITHVCGLDRRITTRAVAVGTAVAVTVALVASL